ncbi:hypothetical protein M1L60_43380 [Actinoplanes sp. TRM 88003]|uniref:Transposase n=1 Tax=Paractinoplanes aksuensis TaxID=2939490 RepID=A0ABT1E2T6_9ACTN|nr:hypothetical protein [Actinoplanes aksuensis]MCO8277443.1 hypothetical protein [Actinoplanes aksuensis]
MLIPTRELTADNLELIEFARAVVDENTDGEDGVHTMGAAVRGADRRIHGGINLTSPAGHAPNWSRSETREPRGRES